MSEPRSENERPKLADRTDEDITNDVVACLEQVQPIWLRMYPDTLMLHVRDTLDDLERSARTHGRAETGCMVVEYDAEVGKTEWFVSVGYRYDEPDDGDESGSNGHPHA